MPPATNWLKAAILNLEEERQTGILAKSELKQKVKMLSELGEGNLPRWELILPKGCVWRHILQLQDLDQRSTWRTSNFDLSQNQAFTNYDSCKYEKLWKTKKDKHALVTLVHQLWYSFCISVSYTVGAVTWYLEFARCPIPKRLTWGSMDSLKP